MVVRYNNPTFLPKCRGGDYIPTIRGTLTSLSPLLISSEEKGKLGYDFVVQNNKAYRIDLYKILSKIARNGDIEKEVNELVGKMMDYNNFNMDYILRNKRISPSEVAMYQIGSEIPSAVRTYTVHFFIKDSANRVYIPGSSIKGAIKTYYAGPWLWKEVRNPEEIRKMIRESREGAKVCDIPWEREFKQNKRRKDPLIRDVMPQKSISEVLTLSTLEVHREKNKQITDKLQTIYAEVMKPDTQFKIEFGRITEEKLKKILKAVDSYCREIAKQEHDFYTTYGRGVYKYENIGRFYESLQKRSSDEYIFRIGTGSSFLFTSLLPVLKLVNYNKVEDEYRKVLPRNRPSNATTIPCSRRLTKISGNLYPLGWVSLKIEWR